MESVKSSAKMLQLKLTVRIESNTHDGICRPGKVCRYKCRDTPLVVEVPRADVKLQLVADPDETDWTPYIESLQPRDDDDGDYWSPLCYEGAETHGLYRHEHRLTVTRAEVCGDPETVSL